MGKDMNMNMNMDMGMGMKINMNMNMNMEGKKTMKLGKLTWIILIIIAVMTISPLLLVGDSKFGGADGEAEVAITEINPDYEPWFASIIEPASGEIESLLFSLQAALGAGILGYGIAYLKYGKKELEKS